MKIKLNEPVRIDGEFHGNGEVVDVSLKPKEKNKDVNED
jgi:hypothetical protein